MGFQPPERFLRPVAPVSGWERIGSRNIYILPSAQGMLFTLVLGLMLIGAINYANSLGFLLTFLLASVGVTTMIQTWRNLLGLEVRAEDAEPVFAGQAARFPIRFRVNGNYPRSAIHLELSEQEWVQGDLDPGQPHLLLAMQTGRRGIQPLTRVVISSRAPLGLFRAWSYLDLPASCLVYPSPGESPPRIDHPDYSHSLRGDKGVGVDDFAGLRTYRPGDSPRHLNWKTLAREQPLQSKQFGGDRSDRVWLDFNALDQADTELRLQSLCRGVLQATREGLEFGLRLPGRELPPARGKQHRLSCLEALARYGEAL